MSYHRAGPLHGLQVHTVKSSSWSTVARPCLGPNRRTEKDSNIKSHISVYHEGLSIPLQLLLIVFCQQKKAFEKSKANMSVENQSEPWKFQKEFPKNSSGIEPILRLLESYSKIPIGNIEKHITSIVSTSSEFAQTEKNHI